MMEQKAKTLRERVEKLSTEFKDAERELKVYVLNCRHVYGSVKYDPIYHKAYTSPGDPPGTMGIDWRGPVHVPAETKKRWTRECQICGEVEITTKVRKTFEENPDFGEDNRRRF